MTGDDFDEYMRTLDYVVEVITGVNQMQYSVVKDVKIPTGSLKGNVCDVALQRPVEVPYVVPSAVHTRPHLLPMNTEPPYATQPGHIGPEWQYWSRRYGHTSSPCWERCR